MFGVVPKPLWERRRRPTSATASRSAMRPLLVRGAAHDAHRCGHRRQDGREERDIYGVDRARHLDHALAEAGLRRGHRHRARHATCTSITPAASPSRDATGASRRGFPRARYVVAARRVGGRDAPARAEPRQLPAENFVPLAEAGVLELVDDDQTIMPGVRVRRTGGHTMHHQIVWIESGGKTAVFVADLIPTTAHVPDAVDHGLRPLSDGHAAFKKRVRSRGDRARDTSSSSSTIRPSPPGTSARRDGERLGEHRADLSPKRRHL